MLGIDLGGASMPNTGYVVLDGESRPHIRAADWLRKCKTPEEAERRLLDLIGAWRPSLVAIDAPLTLPPCLTCPSFCRGPGKGLCELKAAELVWEQGGNPVTERLCEVLLRPELDSGPLPTMRIGQIAARGAALARRLAAMGSRAAPWGSAEVLEVYPYATLSRLGNRDRSLRPKEPDEESHAFAHRILRALGEQVDGIESHRAQFQNGHVLDALVAAYTGWLSPDDLEDPGDFNVASGWIWLPQRPA